MKEDAAALVSLIAQKVFGGVLPPYPAVIINAFLVAVPTVRDAPREDQKAFADALNAAISEFLLAQGIAERAEFLA